jgi:plastocyanin
MKSLSLMMAAAFLAGTAVAFATEHSVFQKGKVFSESNVTIKKGDTLLFVNNDSIVHNVMSNTPGNEFNLGAVQPGISTPVSFKAAGDVRVICAIHPTMKLTVKVTD